MPRVSAFTSPHIDKILALKPDLVLTFSDLQANIAADLIRRAFNVLDMIRMRTRRTGRGARRRS
jgi:hypothetical protein